MFHEHFELTVLLDAAGLCQDKASMAMAKREIQLLHAWNILNFGWLRGHNLLRLEQLPQHPNLVQCQAESNRKDTGMIRHFVDRHE